MLPGNAEGVSTPDALAALPASECIACFLLHGIEIGAGNGTGTADEVTRVNNHRPSIFLASPSRSTWLLAAQSGWPVAGSSGESPTVNFHGPLSETADWPRVTWTVSSEVDADRASRAVCAGAIPHRNSNVADSSPANGRRSMHDLVGGGNRCRHSTRRTANCPPSFCNGAS